MIVQSLVQYYDALAAQGKIARDGWCKERVSYALSLSEAGELLQVVSLLSETDKKKPQPQSMIVPERSKERTGTKIVGRFLCDNSSYMLGIDSKGKPERAVQMFQCNASLHQSLLDSVDTPIARSIVRFFHTWNPLQAEQHAQIAPILSQLYNVNFIFLMDGEYAHHVPEIQEAWDVAYAIDEDSRYMRCLVTGNHEPIARTHPKVQLPHGQSVGNTLIGFNKGCPAYESYGNVDEQGYNAPVGKKSAFAYTTALNHLIIGQKSHISVGNDTVVFWSEDAEEEIQEAFSWLAEPRRDEALELEAVMKRVEEGKAVRDPALEKAFHLLCLSPNAARISVRFYYRDTFEKIILNFQKHYAQLEIDRPSYDPWQYISLYYLLQETVNKNSRDKTPEPLLGGAVFRSIITGARYPEALCAAVLRRIRAEHDVTRGRAAIIKAYLTRNYSYTEKEGVSVSLNETATTPAYVLGRLFAVLEDLQERANPGINATIKDRFFNSACATPASAFPTLLRLGNHHMAKLDTYQVYYEKQIGQLLDKLEFSDGPAPFPTQLDLNAQGMFILGYYHQTQHRYKKKEEK